jgi:hypothetical protein
MRSPVPFRLRVLQALTDALCQISPINGYETDLTPFTDEAGGEVFRVIRGRDRFGDSDSLPLISVLEDFRANDVDQGTHSSGTAKNEWKLLIQGFVADDPVNRTDAAYYVAADVLKALALQKKDTFNILGLGNAKPCVSAMRFEQPVVRPGDGTVSATAYFFLSVTLTLVEDLENPFA